MHVHMCIYIYREREIYGVSTERRNAARRQEAARGNLFGVV